MYIERQCKYKLLLSAIRISFQNSALQSFFNDIERQIQSSRHRRNTLLEAANKMEQLLVQPDDPATKEIIDEVEKGVYKGWVDNLAGLKKKLDVEDTAILITGEKFIELLENFSVSMYAIFKRHLYLENQHVELTSLLACFTVHVFLRDMKRKQNDFLASLHSRIENFLSQVKPELAKAV